MEAESFASGFGRRRFRQERVARGVSHPLSRPLENPHPEKLGPSSGEGEEDLHRGGEAVTCNDETLSLPRGVGQTTREDLRESADALRDALHESDDEGIRRQDLDQEEREDGENHLAAHVGEERHEPEYDDVRGESVSEGLAGYHGLTADGTGMRRRSPRTRSQGALLRTSCSDRRRRPQQRRRSTAPRRRARKSRNRAS